MASSTPGSGPNPIPQTGQPRIGIELGRGAEGIVYEDLDRPGWVAKVFHPGSTSPLQARNEFANLQKARAILPDNVVKVLPPADPRQSFLVKEEVFVDKQTPADQAAGLQVERIFVNSGVQDAAGNVIFGHTADNPTPRWILIE